MTRSKTGVSHFPEWLAQEGRCGRNVVISHHAITPAMGAREHGPVRDCKGRMAMRGRTVALGTPPAEAALVGVPPGRVRQCKEGGGYANSTGHKGDNWNKEVCWNFFFDCLNVRSKEEHWKKLNPVWNHIYKYHWRKTGGMLLLGSSWPFAAAAFNRSCQ